MAGPVICTASAVPTMHADFEGNRTWYLNNRLHRVDGPAVEMADGTRKWYLVGVKLTADEHAEFQALSEPVRETAVVFLGDGMPPAQAVDTAQRVLR
jgi:hypothetical protein